MKKLPKSIARRFLGPALVIVPGAVGAMEGSAAQTNRAGRAALK
jgi:hypothetical protein